MRHTPRLLTVLLAPLLAAPALAQDLEYEKYTLDNGLTVILHEDHSLPIVNVNTWFYVGAKNEPAGRSGFAHLFEHLMFMGTERVPGSRFDQLMEAGGGANNASTGFDRTNYFSWGPAELLPTLLWLDADRLEDLGRTMTQEKLDLQRDVVRNERRETTENTPYGRSEVQLVGLLYPEGHPYHDDVIGSHEDLQAATVDDVKEFFANFYVPRNASLVVAGDFDPATVKPLIAELYGDIPGGVKPTEREVGRPRLEGEIRYTMLDQVQLPLVRIACASPDIYAPGDAEMDVLAEILGKEKSGRLYRRLVMEEGVAVEVSASQQSAMLGSTFVVDVLTRPDADLDRIEQLVDEELERLWTEGVTEEELEQVCLEIERRTLSRLESLRAKADRLNAYQFYFGEPNSFRRDLDRYRAITPASLAKWRVLEPESRVVLRVLPEEPQRAESARDSRPEPLPARSFTPEAPRAFTLSNGVPVTLWSRRELPLVQLSLLVEAPGETVIDPPRAEGSGDLLAQMLTEGAGDRDALAFATALEDVGASLRANADRRGFVVSLSALRRNFESALALLGDAVRRPRFAEEDWRRVKILHLEALRQRQDDPGAVAARVSSHALFGDVNPFGRPTSGTLASVEGLELASVVALHDALFGADRAHLVVAGDLDEAQARALLEPVFGGWKAARGGGSEADWSAPSAAKGLRVLLVDRPGAVQTVIRFALPGIRLDDPRRVPFELIGTVLGGTFTSRLNANLREEKGFTYGASCRYQSEELGGSFVAGSSVRADVTGEALTEFLEEFARLRGGDLTGEELEKARGALRQETVERFGSLRSLVSTGIDLLQGHRPFASLADDLAAQERVTTKAANAHAREAIPLERGVLVLVGDARLVREQLAGLDLPLPVEVTAEGDPVR